ncbi:MAG: glycerophosphodiester phosphodiesterase [Negativicutes bacterium]|jgi:glycerophosphoryl diester phosphodiesterase
MYIYAHRGGRAGGPENTMAAFTNALACGADGIELDVQLTKDGHVVICHDYKINRTSDGCGLLKNLTLSELKEFDFGAWYDPRFKGQKLLTLAEYLEWHITTPLLLNIEIKNGPVIYPGIEELVIRLVERYHLVDRVIISSFYHPSLLQVKKLNSTIKTGVLFEGRPIHICRLAQDVCADYLHPFWQNLDSNFAEAARANRIGINTYTVNDQDDFDLVRSIGVDAIITDCPEKFIR